MKLIEVIVGIWIIVTILSLWANMLILNVAKKDNYIKEIKNISEYVSLYNYSKVLVDNLSYSQTGYIWFSWNNFYTGVDLKYPYKCDVESKSLIQIWKAVNILFCEIEFNWNKIYNYKILN